MLGQGKYTPGKDNDFSGFASTLTFEISNRYENPFCYFQADKCSKHVKYRCTLRLPRRLCDRLSVEINLLSSMMSGYIMRL